MRRILKSSKSSKIGANFDEPDTYANTLRRFASDRANIETDILNLRFGKTL